MNTKRFFEICYASVVIAIAITIINYFLDSNGQSLEECATNLAINLMFSFSLTLANNWMFHVMDGFLTWEENGLKRLIIGAVGSVIVTMLVLFILLFVVRVMIYDESVSSFFENQEWEWYWFGLIITLVITVIFHAIYFYKELQRRRVKEQTTIARSAEAQFDALKNQLDPHFLFNSLNVLVSLIEENPKAATKFTTSLSKVYRYVLEQRNKSLIAVDEELQFARTYVHLLKMRFEDSLEIQIPEHSSNPDMKVVPLSLQLLLENAVKHNIVSDSKPLEISIYEKGNQLVVENNLQPKAVVKKGSGVGLKNIASRYGLLTDRVMGVEKGADAYKVEIPILLDEEVINNKKSRVMENYSVEDVELVHAKQRVREIKTLYDSIFKTVGIVSLLAVINYFTSDFPWVIFPALGMGIGILFEYLRTTDQNLFLGRKWQEAKIEKMLEEDSLGKASQETYQQRFTKAKDRVEELRAFYQHFLLYIVINMGIAVFNFYIDQWRTPWFLFALGGWGIGLMGHAIATFDLNPLTNKDWEQRKIQEMLKKEKNSNK
ncbi:MAG: 2TM domain-containing protein [Nonlabens sp.]